MLGKLIFLVIFVELAICQTPLTSDEAAKIKAKVLPECKAKSNLTDEEFDRIMNKRMGSKTKAGDCFIACTFKGCDYMAPNNTLLEKNLRDRLERTKDQVPIEEQPKRMDILEFCMTKRLKDLSDECEVAKQFIACVINKKKELGVTTKMW